MNLQNICLAELERETENTRRMLNRIEDRHLDFKPHEKSMSLGALAAHIVELHNWVSGALSSSEFNFHTDYKPFKATSAQELLDVLNASYQKNTEQIQMMTDSDWSEEWTLRAGDHIIAQMPKAAAFRFMVQNHLIHHRGQLSVYLRLNNIPVPGVYGPSADDSNS